MSHIVGVLLGIFFGLLAGLAAGICFILVLGCTQPEMQLITMIHSTLAMSVMGAWALPALLPNAE